MWGKSYTMQEMKSIVDYLVEHKAYGEIKGRKMWMDYAKSKLTTRTWQSLKETFLKRILPDITNPYYKLTAQQMASFRQGKDLESIIKNKLEIPTVHGDSSDDDSNKEPPPLSPSTSKEGKNAGEDILCSKRDRTRSSTDTVVIGPSSISAEDLQKDLELSTDDNVKENTSPVPYSTKSIRDYITYSEPLTPMLQEVLHDFASEDEGDEPQMQITEYPEPPNRQKESSPVKVSSSSCAENNDSDIKNSEDADNSSNKDKINNNIAENNVSETERDLIEHIDKAEDVQCINVSEKVTENNKEDHVTDVCTNGIPKNNDEINIETAKSQDNSDTMTDTLIPNNQEAFKELHKAGENSIEKLATPSDLDESKNDSRKRLNSQDECNTPKKRICTDKTRDRNSSDCDAIPSKQTSTKLNSIKSMNSPVPDSSQTETKIGDNCVNNIQNNTHETVSEQEVNRRNWNEDEVWELVPDSSSTRPSTRQALKDVSIEVDKDGTSITCQGQESPRPIKGNETAKKNSTMLNEETNYVKEVINDVVILKSQSESASDRSSNKNNSSLRLAKNVHRDSALANVFGFSNGVKSNRRKYKSFKRETSRQCILSSSSSEWTSDTEVEYVSLPRGRRSKRSRKYLKPKSARVYALEENGGLFVIYGKRIYPVVKDGKLTKNYVNYSADKNTDDEESYWKLKYVEEKKKIEELTKLLEKTKEKETVPPANEDAIVHPPPPAEIPKKPATESPKQVIQPNAEQIVKEQEKKQEVVSEEASKTLTIKFIKNNETVHVEGHWSHIHPVLDHVVQMLHKEPEPRAAIPQLQHNKTEAPAVTNQTQQREVQPPVNEPEVSRHSTPISIIHLDEDVSEKIDKLEEEIFKQIEEREIAEHSHIDIPSENVTKRKLGRPKRSKVAPSTADNTESVTLEPMKKKSLLHPADEQNDTVVTTKRRRMPSRKTINNTPAEKIEDKSKTPLRRSGRRTVHSDDRYGLSSTQQPEHSTDTKNMSTGKTPTTQKTKGEFPVKIARIFSSPDNISINSIESSHGYQDSDGSNISVCPRKKRRLSLTVLNRARCKTQRGLKRKPQPYMHDDTSCDSNATFITASLKSSSSQSSSLNTEVYRSESYQMLFPQGRNSITRLEKINERSPVSVNINCLDKSDENVLNVLTEKSSLSVNETNNLSPAFVNYAENSNNIILPPSPVLPIAKKLSVSKNAFKNTEHVDVPDTHKEINQTMLNDYMVSDVDMSVPLMEQERSLQKSYHGATENHFNLDVPEISQEISNSLLSKVHAVNITEPTLSESIHQKLKNLLLESAKKIAKQMSESHKTDNANKMEICESESRPKPKGKKRCSTPRKRRSKLSLKLGNTSHIEEEHVESYGTGKSQRPPALIVSDTVEKNNNAVETDLSTERQKSDRIRKKKDVIKVKILKPKMKRKNYNSDNSMQNEAKTSLQVDSGINDTESVVSLQPLEDSVDLIHNHSDTCLQGHECIGDSVEIIHDNVSVISLNSNSLLINKVKCASLTVSNEDNLLDICCENAQDAVHLYTATEVSQCTSNDNSCIFKSPTNNISPINSLLTDDLSDEICSQDNTGKTRVSKWYLLSEDETSNTNNEIVANTSNSNSGYGANLQEIFPITCAVPDLSTITEENTVKFMIDGNTNSECNSKGFHKV